MRQRILFFLFVLISVNSFGQSQENLIWSKDGQSYYMLQEGNIVKKTPTKVEAVVWVNGKSLVPAGSEQPIQIQKFTLSENHELIMIQTNSKKVWRYETIGDFYVFNIKKNKLQQIGKGLAPSSLQFAKISPNNEWVAFVNEHNIYAENLLTGKREQLTTDGTKYLINGTFDWAYEEEFFCRDGFRWSPDSKHIAFWQVNANGVKNYLMINNTDSAYPFAVPVEYPIAGEKPSKVKIGIVDVMSKKTNWMESPDDAVLGSYIPRMEWVPNSKQIIYQHLNRKQNLSLIHISEPTRRS